MRAALAAARMALNHNDSQVYRDMINYKNKAKENEKKFADLEKINAELHKNNQKLSADLLRSETAHMKTLQEQIKSMNNEREGIAKRPTSGLPSFNEQDQDPLNYLPNRQQQRQEPQQRREPHQRPPHVPPHMPSQASKLSR